MCNYRIIIVDDNLQFRKGLRFYLENILNCKVIAEANNGYEFLKLDNIGDANFILMDIEMPGQNGIETARQLLASTKANVVAITNYEDNNYLTKLMVSGFKGCVFKRNIYDNLGPALNQITNSGSYFPKDIYN